MRWLVVFTILALAGCEAGRSDTVSRHQAVDNFNVALGRIMPVAKELCTQRAVPNCDFAILVDDTPGQAPNATQSVAADGRPVLTFTASVASRVV